MLSLDSNPMNSLMFVGVRVSPSQCDQIDKTIFNTYLAIYINLPNGKMVKVSSKFCQILN